MSNPIPLSMSLYPVGDFARECREAIEQAQTILADAIAKANATRDTYTIRQWDHIAQAARRVLVAYGAMDRGCL